jgi:ABC-type transport system involved in multi-copper enzyme maturation permease subunit
MNTVFALSGVVIKELYRRKDFYVLFVLTALITLVVGSVRFFDDDKIVRVVKEASLLLIWISALVIAVGTAARQLPAERENRTIFPLLAKPVSRAQVVLGKFAGCWFACGLTLVVFYLFFGVVVGSREHHWPVGSYIQALWLQWAMLGIVTALVLLGSLVFAAPSSNSTICIVVVVGILLLGGYLNRIAAQQSGPIGAIIYGIYFLIPHLEWFDLRKFIEFDQGLVSWSYCVLTTVYAAIYAGLLLFASWLVFRHKALNV